MLTLGRRRGQNILIGDDIIITVVSIRGDQVRLGITAPKDVMIDREEVRRQIIEQGGRQIVDVPPIATMLSTTDSTHLNKETNSAADDSGSTKPE